MKQTRILLVTPQVSLRTEIIRAVATKPEFTVDHVTTGAAAIRQFALAAPYDLAFFDHDMAEMSGLELLKQIRCGRTPAPRGLAIGLVTIFADHKLLYAAVALDLNTLLLAPISQNDITRRIEKLTRPDAALKTIEDYAEIMISPSAPPPPTENDERAPVAVLRPTQRDAPKNDPSNRSGLRSNLEERKFGPRRRVAAIDLKPGWQIDEDLIGPTGARLIAAGAVLDSRLVTRLRNLDGAEELGPLWARPPA